MRWLIKIAAAALLICIGPTLLAADASPGIGANKFDLALQYLGKAAGGDGSAHDAQVERAIARKAIADAHAYGIRYFRVAMTGFAPSAQGKPGDLDLWVRDRPQYWAAIDEMMKDLARDRIKLIPTFVWNHSQFPAMTGETVGDLLRNPDSRAYRLLSEYVTEFVTRYGGSGSILFYELTNELNLDADLDTPGRCRKEKPADLCSIRSGFTTDDAAEFVGRLSRLVKSIDRAALVSSGFAAPRPAAMHLSKHPELQGNKPDWTRDSIEEMEGYIARVHKDVDIISVHLYEGDDSKRFGSDDPVDLLVALKRAADKLGKPLFVGEFGESDIGTAGPGSFVDRMLDKLAALRVPYSAIWVWEYRQRDLSRSGADAYSVEPGHTDRVIEHLGRVNSKAAAQRP